MLGTDFPNTHFYLDKATVIQADSVVSYSQPRGTARRRMTHSHFAVELSIILKPHLRAQTHLAYSRIGVDYFASRFTLAGCLSPISPPLSSRNSSVSSKKKRNFKRESLGSIPKFRRLVQEDRPSRGGAARQDGRRARPRPFPRPSLVGASSVSKAVS